MLKISKNNVLKYIPKCERNSDKPTTICYTPMTKQKFDEYITSIASFERNKTVTKLDKVAERLFYTTLAKDERGVYIYNVVIDDEFKSEIKDLDEAVQFLLNLTDIDTAFEIEQVLRGSSMLGQEEEKN